MQTDYRQVRELLARVRARWRRLIVFQSAVRAALAASGVLAAALFLAALATSTGRAPMVLAGIGIAAVVLVGAALVWGLWPVREVPTNARIARFIEERDPSLDDRLVSAVHLAESGTEHDATTLAGPLVADAGRRASTVDPASVVPEQRLRRAGYQAAGAALLLAAVAFFGREAARQSLDALSLAVFPSRVTLEVTPGHARVQAGSPLTIEARLVGNRAPVVAQVLRAAPTATGESDDLEEWAAAEMTIDPSGRFALTLASVGVPFKYRVVAGAVRSPIYEVRVARAPRVARIDVEYIYPAALRMPPRTDEDGGDIYAPAGTDVRIRVHTDVEAATGRMTLSNGRAITLTPQPAGTVLVGALKVEADDSYRVALADREGLANPGDIEYFIRMLEDRPPDVHVSRPARDRTVTRLEEIAIEAEAEDDYGVDRLELVYAVRGVGEKVVPLRIPPNETAVSGAHTLYLEDLDVRPGDFVSYYVRARDVARGKRASEARSDIFFLEVRPFDQEFSLASQSQQMGAGGRNNQSIDDLVATQKEIIVATWKLDRRAKAASGARSEQDIKAVARAEAELKTRVEETSSSFRESTMRDPRRAQPQPGRGGQPPRPAGPDAPNVSPRAGQTLPEEDAMTAAAAAMGRAVESLDRLKTSEAYPSEMEALNHLLKAQADVKRRQVQRQQTTGGGGQNRTSQDLSSLFDRELQKQQQTNYETPTSTEQRETPGESMLDKIKELARRQDELLRREQELAQKRDRLTLEELKRELERLTREQSELRQRAEEMARQMGNDERQRQQQQGAGQQAQGAGQQAQRAGQTAQGAGQQAQGAGQRSVGPSFPPSPADGSAGFGGRAEALAEAGSSGASDPSQRMREVSEAMRNAANELRRADPGQASASGNRALERLQDVQRQMQAAAPDERRRALGDMQLEARQLAEAERRIAAERGKAGSGEAGADTLRRLAGEQERLADRARRLQNGLEQQANAAVTDPTNRNASGQRAVEAARDAARDASREIGRQRLADRMQQSADQMRNASRPELSASARGTSRASSGGRAEAYGGGGQVGRDQQQPGRGQQQLERAAETREQEEIARSLDRLADRIAAGTGPTDDESRKLTDQLARAQELGERIESLTRELENLAQAGGGASAGDVARLRDEYARQLQQTRDLLDELRRETPNVGHGGMGLTFEGQGMVLSAPGTEAFKQDFAKWEQLRKQATLLLEQAASEISRKLQAKEARDRLAAGVEARPPDGYQQQVDAYFKALAEKRKP